MKTSRQRIFLTAAVALLAVAALYFLIPKFHWLRQLPDLLAQADPAWLGAMTLRVFSSVLVIRSFVGGKRIFLY